jgi:signal peptidase I
LIAWRPAVAEGPGAPTAVPDRDPPTRPSRRVEYPLLVAVAVGVAFVVKTFVAQAFYIPSASMVPELAIGDRVVVSKLAYRLHEPRRGDVVVFDCPPRATCARGGGGGALPLRVLRGVLEAVGLRQPSTEEFVKRVVGLPGERVEARGGTVFVDGRELVEPYLPPGTRTSDFGPVELGEGEYWMMGDNRSNSQDSRFFGPVRRAAMVGRAIVRAWPPSRAGYL